MTTYFPIELLLSPDDPWRLLGLFYRSTSTVAATKTPQTGRYLVSYKHQQTSIASLY